MGSISSSSHNSMFPTSWIISFDSWLKGLNDWHCCRCSLKSVSVRVVFDFLNQVSNAGTVQLLHGRMWQSWNVEVDVLLVDCTIELVVHVEWRNFTMFFDSMLFFHCVCTWAVVLIRLPWSIVSLLNTGVFRQITSFNHAGPWSQVALIYLKHRVFRENLYHRSPGNGTFHL